jgi:hypothetical protein
MPTFSKRVIFSDLASSRFLDTDAVIDSGAEFSQIPEDAADYLGLQHEGERMFRLANGTAVVRPWGGVIVTLADTGDRAPSLVVIAERGTPVILGAHSLDALGLGIDTAGERLIPKVFQLLSQTRWPTV